jgi:hypothetical protein
VHQLLKLASEQTLPTAFKALRPEKVYRPKTLEYPLKAAPRLQGQMFSAELVKQATMSQPGDMLILTEAAFSKNRFPLSTGLEIRFRVQLLAQIVSLDQL